MTEQLWRWVQEASVLAIHDAQIAEHGGMSGVRDFALLLSALARPQNLVAYGAPDIADLAASYAAGLMQDHPFFDGNKRTAWVVAEVFLLKHGYCLVEDDRDSVEIVLAAASGSMPEAELAAWYRRHIHKV
jgi:death on curing protein